MIVLPIAVLGAGVVVQLALGAVLSRAAKGWLAFATCLAAFGAALALVPAVIDPSGVGRSFRFAEVGRSFRFAAATAYRLDGLGLVFLLMATGIGAAILLYSVRYMEHEPRGTTRFYALMLTFVAGLANLVSTADLLALYVSWEVVGLCSYFLVGFWYTDERAASGARKVLLMTHLPGYALLAAILALHQRTGSFLWTDPGVAAAFSAGVFGLMLFAAMAKSVVFPLHSWIPEAMQAPTPVSALLHSACYVKAGVYLVARMYSFGPWHPSWHAVVVVLGCATMVVGALSALVQTDLKRLLAYSTISQLGHIVTALGLGTAMGMAAGLFYCASHGLFKATLFLCAGAVQHATGTRDLSRLGGLASRMPGTAVAWLIASAAIIGVPLTNGFVAKWMLFGAALDAGWMGVVAVAWLVSVFTAFYIVRATASVFYGRAPEWLAHRGVHEAPLSMRLGMWALALGCVVFGVAPQLLLAPVGGAALRSLGFAEPLRVSWGGVQTTSGQLQVTAGALVVGAAVLAVLALQAVARRRRPATVAVFAGGDPMVPGEGGVGTADFAAVAESAFGPLIAVADPDPVYRAASRVLERAAARVERAASILVRRPLVATLVAAAILLLALRAV